MVQRYRRFPAAIVLIAALALGALYVRTLGRQEPSASARPRLEALIAEGKATARDWLAYADLLTRDKKPDYAAAAEAYKHVLEMEPDNDDARQGRAVALAQAGSEDELYLFLNDLILNKAKLAVDLCERQEIRKYLTKERFAVLYRDAKAAAMD